MLRFNREMALLSLVLLSVVSQTTPVRADDGVVTRFHNVTSPSVAAANSMVPVIASVEIYETTHSVKYSGYVRGSHSENVGDVSDVGDWETGWLEQGAYYEKEFGDVASPGSNVWVSYIRNCLVEDHTCTVDAGNREAVTSTYGWTGQCCVCYPVCRVALLPRVPVLEPTRS